MAFTHSLRSHEAKVGELRAHSLNEIAGIILDLEAELEECRGKLDDAQALLADAEQAA